MCYFVVLFFSRRRRRCYWCTCWCRCCPYGVVHSLVAAAVIVDGIVLLFLRLLWCRFFVLLLSLMSLPFLGVVCVIVVFAVAAVLVALR